MYFDVGDVTGNVYILRNNYVYAENAGGTLLAAAHVTPAGANYGLVSSSDESLLYVFGMNNANLKYAPFIVALSAPSLTQQQRLITMYGDYYMSKFIRKDGTRMYWVGGHYNTNYFYIAGLLLSWPD